MEVFSCLTLKDAADFERLSHGTMVLDEVTDLSVDLQARLATLLARSSGDRARLLATTVHDPREAVRGGLLREDLYYALSTLTISVPPLSERSGDIAALSAYFLGLRGASSAPLLTPPVLAALQEYSWPGNVRELRHVLEYAVTLSGGGPVFLSHLPPHFATITTSHGDAVMASGELDAVIARWLDAGLSMPAGERPNYDAMLDQIESVMLRYLLERHDNRPTRLAAALGLHRATLRQKLRRFGLQRDDV
jgi:DNA-binding NtrC family response regulator